MLASTAVFAGSSRVQVGFGTDTTETTGRLAMGATLRHDCATAKSIYSLHLGPRFSHGTTSNHQQPPAAKDSNTTS